MSSPAAPKTSLITGMSATETKLLALAHVCLKNDKIDYDKLALNAGIKSSSAQTLFRNAKRKLDKLYGDDNADGSGNGGQSDMSPEDTPSKRGKSNAKAPRTPKTPKTPKATKTPKTPKGGKAAIKSEENEDQVSIKLEFDPTATESATNLAEGVSRETAVAEPIRELTAEPVIESLAESFAGPTATAEDIKVKTEKADENDEAALDMAVKQHLPESPLPDEEDDAYEQDEE
ncbi:hypothetical protein LT330_002623 [Penicillium expansum]|uniref:Uncharacterized protein n=1 Tax=Penicillium expansum TaxID=27334 RepID=A0A0A2JG75_PENEN|nr:hypothetical protein PEX2_062590 [Penicillium expansum]KAK4862490.1 hypothetical protein LT330_002623 [Penicillium expansum]KGO45105.1 hypothetical protein PEXP_091350 [Penicillium expansum]KGO53648.1 hypothetical protein PEX2_062590 [Penicillium expansum]